MGALDTLIFGYRQIAQGNAAPVLARNKISFQGTAVASVLDDPVNLQTVVTINQGAGSALTSYGGDINAASTATQQFVSSLSGNASGFGHGAASSIAVNGTSAVLNWIDDAVRLQQGGATRLQLASLNDFIQFGSTSSVPSISHAAQSTNIQGASMQITPQQSTHATNAGGGHLQVILQTPAGTGTRAYLQVIEGASVYASLGRGFGGGSFGSLFLGSVAPATGIHSLQGDGATQTTLNVASGGTLYLAVNSSFQVSVTTTQITLEPAILAFDAPVLGGTIGQLATSSQTNGNDLFISPQQSAQVTNFGGGNLTVALQSPTGSAVRVYLNVKEANTIYASLGRYNSGGSNYGALYLGSGVGGAQSSGNYAIISDDSTGTIVNAPSGGALQLFVGGTGGYFNLQTNVLNIMNGGQIFQPWAGSNTGQNQTIYSIPFVSQTPTAAAATIYTYAVPSGHTVTLYVYATLVGQGTCCAIGTFVNTSGTVTQVGSTVSLWSSGLTANPTVSFSIASPNVNIQGASNISSVRNWQCLLLANLA